MKVILASQSQFRKKALDILGLKYEVRPAHIDEKAIRDKDFMVMCKRLAEEKAKVLDSEDAIIVSGDLICVFNNRIYEKPGDVEEAKQMLRDFSGNAVDIIASVAVYNTKTKKMLSKAERCVVKFRKLFEYEIEDYCSRYPVTKFAGAFDGDGVSRFCTSITGDHCFLNGVPMNALIMFLRENGLEV
ncbi:MAG: Maf family protein [Candidatus Woesearchaeota archaeon]